MMSFFFFQAEDGIRDADVTGVQTCALPISVLRLIGLRSALPARTVMSARDCRLNGCWVSASNSQATALTKAWSKGGKGRLAAPSRLVLQGKVACGPPATPSLHRTQMQLHPFCGLNIGHKRVLMQQQRQRGPLPQLVLNSPLLSNLFSLLQKRRGKRRTVAR